ncbi:MAG: hypothetical protein A2505_05255 [Deltaproteobacteria bacterium RIFOXYD12_FULL_55_16]|nr:MAG: hypothetical protein A2505_05255 [Deltaproteobacteria bacterium RIFOXYD12_FULL_55_16]
MKAWLAVFFLMVAVSFAWADESPWQKSYRLEAAGKYAEASAALESINGSGEADFALMRRGWLSYLQGRYNESVDFYGRAIAKNQKSLEARNGVTLPLLAQQRWREAAFYARQVLAESAFDYTAHQRLMVAEEGQREWKTLAEHAARVADRYPSDATVLVYLARAHAWLGEITAARKVYGQVLSRIPGHIEATAYLAGKP